MIYRALTGQANAVSVIKYSLIGKEFKKTGVPQGGTFSFTRILAVYIH